VISLIKVSSGWCSAKYRGACRRHGFHTLGRRDLYYPLRFDLFAQENQKLFLLKKLGRVLTQLPLADNFLFHPHSLTFNVFGRDVMAEY
jgi:hypothetical protein